MIDQSIDMLKKNNATSIISVSKIKNHPFKSFWYDSKYLKPFKSDFEKKYHQRQLLPDLYYENGAIYTLWYKTFKKYKSIYGPKIKPMIIDDDSMTIDIDKKFDVFIAEKTLLNWAKFKQKLK